MNKPNKTAIAEKLSRWASLEKKRLRVEAKRDKDLDPHVDRFERATRGIQETAQTQLAQLTPQLAALAAEIEAELLAGVDAKTGVAVLPQVEVQLGKATAVALVTNKPGARVIDALKFFAHTPPAKRVKAFWDCVNIRIAQASEFFGEQTLNTMASKPTKTTVELKLNE